jgi:hypothetical protein
MARNAVYSQVIVNYFRTSGANAGKIGQQINRSGKKVRCVMDEELAKYPELLALARSMTAAGHSLDDILEALREHSGSVIQSIKVIRDTLGIPLPEAKRVVHRSRVWSDMRDAFSELHEVAETQYAEATSEGENGSKQVRINLAEPRDSEDT